MFIELFLRSWFFVPGSLILVLCSWFFDPGSLILCASGFGEGTVEGDDFGVAFEGWFFNNNLQQ
jgi:hypothetical protein